MEAKFEELVDSFITGKIGVSESFLSSTLAASLQQNLIKLKNEGLLSVAGIGDTTRRVELVSIRSDKTRWVSEQTTNDAELEFLDVIRKFIAYLNKTCYTGLNAFEFHYALYEEGTFYGKHKDQFRNNSSRKYSMINYLNENWLDDDGGHLVIHHDCGTQQRIAPHNCKTVFFQSDVLEHEVAIARRPRMSVTGWLKRV